LKELKSVPRFYTEPEILRSLIRCGTVPSTTNTKFLSWLQDSRIEEYKKKRKEKKRKEKKRKEKKRKEKKRKEKKRKEKKRKEKKSEKQSKIE
jgi:flagellar biosynthesis component FlhA